MYEVSGSSTAVYNLTSWWNTWLNSHKPTNDDVNKFVQNKLVTDTFTANLSPTGTWPNRQIPIFGLMMAGSVGSNRTDWVKLRNNGMSLIFIDDETSPNNGKFVVKCTYIDNNGLNTMFMGPIKRGPTDVYTSTRYPHAVDWGLIVSKIEIKR